MATPIMPHRCLSLRQFRQSTTRTVLAHLLGGKPRTAFRNAVCPTVLPAGRTWSRPPDVPTVVLSVVEIFGLIVGLTGDGREDVLASVALALCLLSLGEDTCGVLVDRKVEEQTLLSGVLPLGGVASAPLVEG